jgi:antitoxin ParD1/3/4
MLKSLWKLFRPKQKRQAKEHLESLLLEGLNSGTAAPMTDDDWEDIRKAVRQGTSKSARSL